MGVPVLTLDHVPGHEITEAIGIATSEMTINPNFVTDILSGFSDLLGTRSSVWCGNAAHAQATVLQQLSEIGAQMGADYLVGARFQTCAIKGDKMVLLTAQATAVRTRRR